MDETMAPTLATKADYTVTNELGSYYDVEHVLEQAVRDHVVVSANSVFTGSSSDVDRWTEVELNAKTLTLDIEDTCEAIPWSGPESPNTIAIDAELDLRWRFVMVKLPWRDTDGRFKVQYQIQEAP